MCRKTAIHKSSHTVDANPVSEYNSIGDLFRDYGEEYIEKYKPSREQLKLIRSIRVCRTPALGGHVYTCAQCKHQHFVYNSSGNSRCMICQAVKREQWVDKLKSTLLEVPYMHIVFTVPHQLNSLCRQNQGLMYSLAMKSAWKTIKQIGIEQKFTPGMTSVLHTFGSDMKYHIHVHSLVTYGGLTKNGEWIFPKAKNRMERYERICKRYRSIFLEEIELFHNKYKLNYHQDIESLLNSIRNIRWVVNSTKPTMDTHVIENYLARYINRVAVSPNRLQYAKHKAEVNLIHNDYKNQITGKPPPKLIKTLKPLEAIHQILQHVLPSYFQKSRRYRLHNESAIIKKTIPISLKRNGHTLRTVFEILTQLSKLKGLRCENCGAEAMIKEVIYSDPFFLHSFLLKPVKPPPRINQFLSNRMHFSSHSTGSSMPYTSKNQAQP